jgi:hypothetical protein
MNSLPWFRLYIDLLNDHQVQSLPDPLFRAYINTLCIAAVNNPRGQLPALPQYAFALRFSEKAAEKVRDKLVSAGLLEQIEENSGNFSIKNWEELQPVSDSSSQRVQEHRLRMKRFQPVTETVSVTAQREIDVDLDQKRGEETASVSLSASQDHSFKLTEERWQKAQSIGVPSKAWVEKETAKFDLEHGDKLHTYKDPDKAWLKWLHRGKEYAEQHPNVVPMTPQRRSKMFFAEG